MSRIKSRAQIEICGDCGASGLFIFDIRMIDRNLYGRWLLLCVCFFSCRSIVGINKPWHIIMCRMLFSSSKPR